MKKTFLLLIAILFSMSATVDASLITTRPEGTTTILTTVTGYMGFRTSDGGIGFGDFNFYTDDQMCYGNIGYNLQANGTWEYPFAWVGAATDLSRDYIGSVMIDLGVSRSVVGGFMNYFLWEDGSSHGADPTIEALYSDGTTVLESYDLITDAPISTPGGLNAGAFRGISRDTADIGFLRISGSYIVIHDLTLGGTSVPEPATMLLLGFGLIGLAGFRKKA